MKAAGGKAPATVTDPHTGEVKAVNWYAPALNTVLYRFTDDEVRFILNYGRPFSPMSAWGLVGGGPMNAQQIDTLIAYLAHASRVAPRGLPPERGPTHQLKLPDGPPAEPRRSQRSRRPRRAEAGRRRRRRRRYGEALFNLDLASGAYSCARCHTLGLELRQARRAAARVASAGTSPAGRRTATSRSEPT